MGSYDGRMFKNPGVHRVEVREGTKYEVRHSGSAIADIQALRTETELIVGSYAGCGSNTIRVAAKSVEKQNDRVFKRIAYRAAFANV